MANNSASAIRANILLQLNEVKTANLLADVVEGRTGDVLGFPAVRIYLNSVTTDIVETDKTQERHYIYTLEVVQELTNDTPAKTEARFQDAIDAILDKFREEIQLDNNTEISLPTSTSVGVQVDEQGAVVSAIILLDVLTYIDA